MINLFNLKERRDFESTHPKQQDIQNQINLMRLESDASYYILDKYLLMTDYVHSEDKESLRYMDELYMRVITDKSISDSSRNLDSLIDKLEEDIIASRGSAESNDKKYKFIINFLEASLIRTSREDPDSKAEKFILGRLYRIKSAYFAQITRLNDRSKPAQIKEYIDRYVIGQDDAKMAISTAVYNHMKRMRNPGIGFPTDVVLLIGPSGCGKTEIMRRLRDVTDLPMVFTDVSGLGVSQTKGRHKEDILLSLLNEAKGDLSKAQYGIVFMDEFDKLLVPAISSEGDDVHARVQGQLLTMLEGSDVEIRYRNRDITFNTSHILFVLAGAFEGIEKYIKQRVEEDDNANVGIGFTSISSKNLDVSIMKKNINHKVLIDYGMKKELAGRVEDIAVLESLKKEDFIRILRESKDNIIEKYKKEIDLMNGAELVFEDEAIELIVENVMGMKIGARALTSEVRRVMRDLLYEAPSMKNVSKITITKEVVKGEAKPVITSRD